MHIKSRVTIFITILFLGFVSAAGLVTLDFFGTSPVSFAIPVPNDANWVLRADAFSFVKREAYTLLFESEDDQLITSAEDLLRERSTKNGVERPLYLDLSQDLIAFGTRVNEKEYMGVFLKTGRPSAFEENIGYYLSKNQTVALNGNTALVLTALDKQGTTKTQQQLTNRYINSKPRHFKRENIPHDELIALEVSKAGIAGEARNLKLGIELHRHSVDITGHFDSQQQDIPQRAYSLKHKGLFIATSIVPKALTDSINLLLPIASYQFSELNAFTIDIQGIVLDASMGYKPVPKLNMILESKNVIYIDSILQSLPLDMMGPNNSIRIAEMTYYIRLLDPKTLFIGLDPEMIIKAPQKEVAVIDGKLDALMQIGGSALAVGFLEVVPAFRASKEFILSTESISFSITRKAGPRCKLSGKVEFVDGVYPQHAFTKLLLNGFDADFSNVF